MDRLPPPTADFDLQLFSDPWRIVVSVGDSIVGSASLLPILPICLTPVESREVYQDLSLRFPLGLVFVANGLRRFNSHTDARDLTVALHPRPKGRLTTPSQPNPALTFTMMLLSSVAPYQSRTKHVWFRKQEAIQVCAAFLVWS